MTDPVASPYYRGEWFEVYNSSGSEVDLEDLVVSDASGETVTVTASVTVAAGEYAVLGIRSNTTLNGGVSVDYIYSRSDMVLGAGSDSITLSYSTTTFDSVAWDNGATFPDPTGATISLDPASLDATDSDDGSNWCAASSTFGDGDYGTPGAENDACPVDLSFAVAGDLVISEVMIDPTPGSSGGLNLSSGYASIVNVASSDVSTMDLIEPGDTANSYLWHKSNGTQALVGGAGNQMPASGSLTTQQIDDIEAWILAGTPQ
jgi:hypothetical protein